MKKDYTYNELCIIMENRGCDLAEIALGQMMDIVGEETGDWPSWSDLAPEWVVKNCGL